MKSLIFPISIVGAGPGDPELLTLKAARILSQAQAVVYDRLIPEAILDMIPKGAARFFAGKSCKQHVMTQDEINDLLVSLAKSCRKTVRLKGGDPFIFGRGGEEAEYLVRHQIPFEIVPGITSASGGSAFAGIPLTHRDLAVGVRYITGHYKNIETALNWKSLADPDTTLVIYMGLANLPAIARLLIEHGLPADFPVAAIQSATTADQRVVVSTLSDIATDVQKAELQPPTLVIVGRVVSLHETLRKGSAQPLDNRDTSHVARATVHV
jgi:uroporphyrin-III C-methyltransferase/precorrin-2 dehydrogenase/sirohydrochlorin ferrochelatase/uroporphyrin-III C-methyltransferase